MTIKTKFQPGDHVFVIYNDKILAGKVYKIEIYVENGYNQPHKVNIYYKLNETPLETKFDEIKVFSSVQALKKSL